MVPQKVDYTTPSLGLGRQPESWGSGPSSQFDIENLLDKYRSLMPFSYLGALEYRGTINTATYGIDIGSLPEITLDPYPSVKFPEYPAGEIVFGGFDIGKTNLGGPIKTYKIPSSTSMESKTRLDLLSISLRRGDGRDPDVFVSRIIVDPGAAYLNYTFDSSISMPASSLETLRQKLPPELNGFFNNSGMPKDIPALDWGLEFTFREDFRIFVPFNRMIKPLRDGGYAIALEKSIDGDFGLGQPFFRQAYVFWDHRNEEISLAAKSASANVSRIVAVGYNPYNTSLSYSLRDIGYLAIRQRNSFLIIVISSTMGGTVFVFLLVGSLFWLQAKTNFILGAFSTFWRLVRETKEVWSGRKTSTPSDKDVAADFGYKHELSAHNKRRIIELDGNGEVMELSGDRDARELAGDEAAEELADSSVRAELPVDPVELDGEPLVLRPVVPNRGARAAINSLEIRGQTRGLLDRSISLIIQRQGGTRLSRSASL
ncbi:hypothetical protein TWF730_008634 [Orbilia blumenaviensis]|uniref:Peptidase A1 domain-containing protein n=1 Tax=Orbilia blumenaviensis TaxID=1796055 RepID=A0AAV9V649_9PEZI